MKYLKYFEEASAYEAYKTGSDYVLPNVSYVVELAHLPAGDPRKAVMFSPYVEPAGAPIGASIYGLDGKFYSASEWTAAGKSNSDAAGVAVSNGEHSFVIHPTAEQASTMWSINSSVLIDGVFTTTDRVAAESDFAGESNTVAILAAVSAGTIADAPAVQYAASITFANGKTGYLPSAGELTLAYQHLAEINSCMTAIGGTKFNMESNRYWSSTQNYAMSAWYWYTSSKRVLGSAKYDAFTVRVVAAL